METRDRTTEALLRVLLSKLPLRDGNAIVALETELTFRLSKLPLRDGNTKTTTPFAK